jgi:arginine/lysine/ornithine decarboxylase
MLLERLEALAQSNTYPFHMPGHKRALEFPNAYALDITEISGFDNLHHAQGLLREAQACAAQLYGSRRAYYLVNGSTCGILAAISAAAPRGSRILVARNSHKAVYHALYLRQLSAEYLYPADTASGIQGQITPQQVAHKLEETPDIRAVVITSPTYDGLVSDVAGIAEAAHRHGIPLIVDEAHGAHFGFHPAFPENATRLDADAVVMSVHKTLPAFTQTALLHLCTDRIDPAQVEKFRNIYETSSPSYLLMAGIEQSLALIEKDGAVLFEEYAKKLAEFHKKTENLTHLTILGKENFTPTESYDFDPGKILIETGGYISGRQLHTILRDRYALELEMASNRYATAMTSVMDTREGFDRLARALHEIDDALGGELSKEPLMRAPREIDRAMKKRMEIHEAEEAPHTRLILKEAIGRTSAATINLYPPGIPLVVPGEEIDAHLVEVVTQCMALGLDVEGPEIEEQVTFVDVVD